MHPSGAPGRLSVALKYSAGSTMLSCRVLTLSVTLIDPAGMDTSKEPPMQSSGSEGEGRRSQGTCIKLTKCRLFCQLCSSKDITHLLHEHLACPPVAVISMVVTVTVIFFAAGLSKVIISGAGSPSVTV